MTTPLNLICLPFAGGSKYAYNTYAAQASSSLRITTLEYAGRGSRMGEPLMSDLDVIVEDLYQQIRYDVDRQEYALYGHSMGGLVAYLLTIKLAAKKHRLPEHLFITGAAAPSDPSWSDKKLHLLPKKEFIKEIKEFGGMPEEVLQNEELLELFEPILRADFKACENYVYRNAPSLHVPLTVITGTEEDFDTENIGLWQKETTVMADFITMPGKHFFILNHAKAIVKIIGEKLKGCLCQ